MTIFGLVDLSSVFVTPEGGRQIQPKCKSAEVIIRPPEPECSRLGEWSLTLHGVPKRQVDIFRKHGGKRLHLALVGLGGSGAGTVSGTMWYRRDLEGVVELEGSGEPLLDGEPWNLKGA